jgi:hypothetical protein
MAVYQRSSRVELRRHWSHDTYRARWRAPAEERFKGHANRLDQALWQRRRGQYWDRMQGENVTKRKFVKAIEAQIQK